MRARLTGLTILILLACWTHPHQTNAPPTDLRVAPPIQGEVQLPGGAHARFTYYFNHNALEDCVRVGNSFVALTESGNLLRFDALTLGLTGQAVVSGRASTITLDGRNRVLIGTQEGHILEVDPVALTQKLIAATEGKIVWLSGSQSAGSSDQMVVAVVDNYPEVLPWPGETSKKYDDRSASVEMKQRNPFFVYVHANGKTRSFPLLLGNNFAFPNSFLLDDSGRLWMGTDKGEWGGELSYMDLHSGSVHSISKEISGVLGFLQTADKRLLVYGGMSHMGMNVGYISQIGKHGPEDICHFESMSLFGSVDDKKDPVQKCRGLGNNNATHDNMPRGPIDHIVEDAQCGGYWIVSAHTLYHSDRELTNWTKTVALGGRWEGGRRYSVGNTPTVNRLIAEKSRPDELFAVMGRDGLERVLYGKVERFQFSGELEAGVIDIWKTSIGSLFLDSDYPHAAWRLDGNKWKVSWFFPDRPSSSEYGDWDFAEPFGDDGNGVFAFSGDSALPGERAIVRLDTQGKMLVVDTWNDTSSRFQDSFLSTAEGTLLKISESELQVREGTGWRKVGKVDLPESIMRRRMLIGRRYVSAGESAKAEKYFDAEFGEFLQLTHNTDGTYNLSLAAYEGHAALDSVFDSFADHDGWFLTATARGMFRFRPEDGKRASIPNPNPDEEIKSICRDERGRIWAAGDKLYISSDDGKHWAAVALSMLSKTYTKRVRPNPLDHQGVVLSIFDRGIVFIDW
jgi:hypothetical protein